MKFRFKERSGVEQPFPEQYLAYPMEGHEGAFPGQENPPWRGEGQSARRLISFAQRRQAGRRMEWKWLRHC